MVSVWVPTYAHERFITQAVESALAQVAPFDFEIVIGDDASPDRTRDIVREFQRRYPDRIRLVLQRRNVGPAANALDTLRACRGRYIAMLEGDDYWTDAGKIASQVGLLESTPGAFICGARAEVVVEGDSAPAHSVLPDGDVSGWGARELFTGQWWFRTSTKMVSRSLLLAVPTHFNRDYAWTMWLIAHTRFGPVCFLDREVAVYRQHAGGAWTGLAEYRRLARDIGTLADLLPWFDPPEQEYLEGLIERHLSALASPEVPAGFRRRTLLSLARRPRGASLLWRHLRRARS